MSRKTGIDLIRQERNSQIYRHGYTKSSDKEYVNQELRKAARYCLSLVGHGPGFTSKHSWPAGWSTYHMNTIRIKDDIGKLKVAGAFYMAENDRLDKPKYEQIIFRIAKRIDRLLKKAKS